MDRPAPYVVQRLIALAVREWELFHGTCLLRGVRPVEIPLPWLLDLIYAWAIEGANESERMKFDVQLTSPGPGEVPAEDDEVWSDDAVFEQFMATAGAQKGKDAAAPAE